jgi:hypothetical protein
MPIDNIRAIDVELAHAFLAARRRIQEQEAIQIRQEQSLEVWRERQRALLADMQARQQPELSSIVYANTTSSTENYTTASTYTISPPVASELSSSMPTSLNSYHDIPSTIEVTRPTVVRLKKYNGITWEELKSAQEVYTIRNKGQIIQRFKLSRDMESGEYFVEQSDIESVYKTLDEVI